MNSFVRAVLVLVTASSVGFLFSAEVHAQAPSQPSKPSEPSGQEQAVLDVQEVIVSATKTPLPAGQVTSAVEVIQGQDLEQKNIKRVIDALRLAQGVFASSNGGPGTLANVRMRGAQSRHTLVVIDGTIVNSPTDGAFNFANVMADNIDRIEIIRGAQSMLWGSDAIGGVIHIITKRGSGTPAGSAFLEYGSFASLREGAQASGSKGPIDFAMSLPAGTRAAFPQSITSGALRNAMGSIIGKHRGNWASPFLKMDGLNSISDGGMPTCITTMPLAIRPSMFLAQRARLTRSC